MYKTTRSRIVAVILIGQILLSSCAIVPLNSGSANSFNPSSYVGSVWNGKVIPYMNEHAFDINTVLNAVKKNVNAAGKKYGIELNGSGWNFLVKGSVKITGYNSNYGQGLANIEATSNSSTNRLQMQTGPVILGTSIRDTLQFVKFGQFENQIQFAEVASAFNKFVYNKVLKHFAFGHMKQQVVHFVGVLSINNGQLIGVGQFVLIPVELTKG